MQKPFQNFEILEAIFIEIKTSVILIENIAISPLSLNSAYQNDDDRWFQIFWKQCFRLPDDFQSIWTWFGRLSLALINELKILYRLYFQQFASNCSNVKICWECESCFVFCKLKGLVFKFGISSSWCTRFFCQSAAAKSASHPSSRDFWLGESVASIRHFLQNFKLFQIWVRFCNASWGVLCILKWV